MQRYIQYILTFLISSTLCINQYGLASNLNLDYRSDILQYKSSVLNHTHLPLKNEKNNSLLKINANYAEGNYPNDAVFTGNVNVNYGNGHLKANEVQLHHKQTKNAMNSILTLDALGNVYYYDNNQIILKGSKIWVNLNTKDANVWNGEYQIVGLQGYGKADIIKQRSRNRYTILKNGSFTSCLPETNIWSIVGSEVIYDRKKQVAEVWNARFKLSSIPIFYSPYLKLPVGDKRRSGFIIPNIKHSTSNCFEVHLPYYFNILPNIDATIIPKYIYKNNNIAWRNEIRYLTCAGNGFIEFDYFPKNKNKSSIEDDQNKWFFCWKHSGILNQIWNFNIDYNRVNNSNYSNNFTPKYTTNTDGYVTQTFTVGYSVQNFNATLSTKKLETLNRKLSDNYTVKPQLDVNWYKKNLGLFNLHIYGQIAHFINTNFDMPKSVRFHLEPIISLPFYNNWLKVNTEAKLMITHYQQKSFKKNNKKYEPSLKSSINRILPLFKIDGKIITKGNIKLGKNCYTQILEPHIKYLYIPYYNQSKIQNYDSSFFQPDYIGLFRDKTYSGLDRISSANQIVTGITARIYDKTTFERFNISVGQIYHLNEFRTGINNINWSKNKKIGSLIWAGNTYWYIKNHCGLRGGLQYDARFANIVAGNGAIEYRLNENQLMQLNYYYANQKCIHGMLPSYINKDPRKEKISQIGVVLSWPVSNKWFISSSYYYDNNENKLADQVLGIKYNFCRYTMYFSYEKKLNSWDMLKKQRKYENIISLNIELHSLNSNNNLNTQQILYSNTLPYRSFL